MRPATVPPVAAPTGGVVVRRSPTWVLARCNNRDVENFDKLATQHKDTVYRQMIRVCGNRADAEDVLIEALLKAYRHLDQLRDAVAFRPWLAQIAKRVCWQLKERESLMPLVQLSSLEDEGREIAGDRPSMETELAARQMKVILQEAIARLPEHYRKVYELRDIDGVSGDDVARELKITASAMKSRLHRARAILRKHLDDALAGRNSSSMQEGNHDGSLR
jgi:RNA polymerase sigma-70 factor, ECF subfamily